MAIRKEDVPTPEEQMQATLDLLCKLTANISKRLDEQAEVLDGLVKAQAQAQDQASPERIAAAAGPAASAAAHNAIQPTLAHLVDLIETSTGHKEKMRLRMLAFAGKGRADWMMPPEKIPVLWKIGGGLFLAVLVVTVMPTVLASFENGCWVMGGAWYDSDGRTPACSFWSPWFH